MHLRSLYFRSEKWQEYLDSTKFSCHPGPFRQQPRAINNVTNYIECTTGAPFSIHFDILKDHQWESDCLAFTVFMDGESITTEWLPNPGESKRANHDVDGCRAVNKDIIALLVPFVFLLLRLQAT